MRRILPTFTLALAAIPVVALALDYTDATDRYADAPFSRTESAAISVLTNAGVVQGNPDGRFEPDRTLNRAEFTKIAMLLLGTPSGGVRGCFPDVRANDWFAGPVCEAKRKGYVQGYTDGFFRPERPVSYAEAVKILSVLFSYPLDTKSGDEWFEPYLRSAGQRGVLLPIALEPHVPLKRGQMARLAAAFLAKSDGDLHAYRDAETGRSARSSSPSSASSTSSLSSLSSVSSLSLASSAPASDASSAATSSATRATGRFLLLGQRTPTLADGIFTHADEDAEVRIATVTLRREVRSIDKMYLVNAVGKPVIELQLQTDDTEKRRWKNLNTGTGYWLTRDIGTVLGIQFQLKPRDTGGVTDELVDFERFAVNVTTVSGMNREVVSTDTRLPLHQTVQAKLTTVQNLLPATGSLQAGAKRKLASFRFSGEHLTNSQLSIKELTLNAETTGVTVSRWKIGGDAEVEQGDCAIDPAQPGVVSCPIIPEMVSVVPAGSGRTLSIYGDVTVSESATQSSLRLGLGEPGAIGRSGPVRWSDGTGRYNWMETDDLPMAGTKWTVSK